MNANLHIPIGSLNQGATLKTEREGTVLPRRNDTVLRRKMELNYGQKVVMQGRISDFHSLVSYQPKRRMRSPFCVQWDTSFHYIYSLLRNQDKFQQNCE